MPGAFYGVLFFSVEVLSALHFKESPVTCQSTNIACDLHDNGLIKALSGIETIEECRQLCAGIGYTRCPKKGAS